MLKNISIDKLFIFVLAYILTYLFYKNSLVYRMDDYFYMSRSIVLKNIEPPYAFRILFPFIFNFLGALISITKFKIIVLLSFFLIQAISINLIKKLSEVYLEKSSNQSAFIFLFFILEIFFQTSYVIDDYFIFLIFLLVLYYSEFLNWYKIFLFIIVSVACRPQSIYFLVFNFIIIYCNKKITINNALRLIFLVVISSLIYLLITYEFKTNFINVYTIEHHLKNNSTYFLNKILPVWIIIISFLLIIFLNFKSLNFKLKLFLIGTVPYTLVFFIKGNIWELDKYLPAIFIFLLSFFRSSDLNQNLLLGMKNQI